MRELVELVKDLSKEDFTTIEKSTTFDELKESIVNIIKGNREIKQGIVNN